MSGSLFVGTSGFAYPAWKGSFYPAGLKDADMLRHYGTRLRSVEINYTFRRHPSDATLGGWVERTPAGFRFALKANQRITHTLRLADADEAVSRFLDRAKTLGERLGPILFQCPPTLRYDRSLIERFVAYLPPTFRCAMEFRHPSWEAARALLEDQGVAWCTADTDDRREGELASEPFAYLRLRRDNYTEEDLAAWTSRIGSALDAGRDVYCYLKHEAAEAAERAVRVQELVDEG